MLLGKRGTACWWDAGVLVKAQGTLAEATAACLPGQLQRLGWSCALEPRRSRHLPAFQAWLERMAWAAGASCRVQERGKPAG